MAVRNLLASPLLMKVRSALATRGGSAPARAGSAGSPRKVTPKLNKYGSKEGPPPTPKYVLKDWGAYKQDKAMNTRTHIGSAEDMIVGIIIHGFSTTDSSKDCIAEICRLLQAQRGLPLSPADIRKQVLEQDHMENRSRGFY